MNKKLKMIIMTGLSVGLSTSVMAARQSDTNAAEYNNHYLDYMYSTYVGKKAVKPIRLTIIPPKEPEVVYVPVNAENADGTLNPNSSTSISTTIIEETSYVETSSDSEGGGNISSSNSYNNALAERYYGVSLGFSYLDSYNITEIDGIFTKSTLKTNDSPLVYSGFFGWRIGSWYVELDGSYTTYGDITTDNPGIYASYNQSIDLYSAGATFKSMFGQISSNEITPFIGIGVGYSKFNITANGQTTDGIFFRAAETLNTSYVRGVAGFTFDISDEMAAVASVDYKIYNDINASYDTVFLEDISALDVKIGLQFKF